MRLGARVNGAKLRERETGVGRNIVETIVGALVLVVASLFVFYAFAKSDRAGPDGYEVIARFGRIDGLKRGSDVTLSGVKVGTVTGFDLDKKTYQAVVHLTLSSSVHLPADTNAKIVSESLLGGMVVVLEPGADKKTIASGGEITNTQDSIPLTELIAKYVFGGTKP
jgi:phospholipid/cholesterol/gamma-HCH transport system substrate-binding protein